MVYHVYSLEREKGRDVMKKMRNRMMSLIEVDLRRYLWNEERFELRLQNESTLSGNVAVGDCVEDEWYVVSMLYRISKEMKNVVIDVLDEDGQFLLIEAANDLPEWIEPDRMKNRVFVYNGNLHIIGLEQMNVESNIVTERILKLASSDSTIANSKIQETIRSRIESVRTQNLTHRSWCVLPIRVAKLLESRPDLVPRLANAFYTNHSSSSSKNQLRVTLKGFRATTKKEKCCKCRKIIRVKFSKFAYAKLRSCPFHAPKGCETYVPKFESNPIHKACVLGLKLCAGLEIHSPSLLRKFSESFEHQCKASNFDVRREDTMKDDDESWMSVAPQDVEQMLNRYKFDEAKLAGDLYEEDEYSVFPTTKDGESFPDAVATAMHRFVKHENATLDGAEVPDKNDDDEVTCRDDVLMSILSGTRETLSELRIGDVAVLCNLKSKSELNGKTCKIIRWLGDEKKRFAVSIKGKNGQNRKISVKPSNLQQYRSGEENSTENLLRQMDAELVGTDVDKSFEGAALQNVRASNEDEERNTSINVDMNLVKSLMKSFELQHGGAGPTSNILGEMNLSIPKNFDKVSGGGDG